MQDLLRTFMAAVMLIMTALPYGSPLVCAENGRVAPPVHNEQCQSHAPDDFQASEDCEHSGCCAATIAVAVAVFGPTTENVFRLHYQPYSVISHETPPFRLPTPPPRI